MPRPFRLAAPRSSPRASLTTRRSTRAAVRPILKVMAFWRRRQTRIDDATGLRATSDPELLGDPFAWKDELSRFLWELGREGSDLSRAAQDAYAAVEAASVEVVREALQRGLGLQETYELAMREYGHAGVAAMATERLGPELFKHADDEEFERLCAEIEALPALSVIARGVRPALVAEEIRRKGLGAERLKHAEDEEFERLRAEILSLPRLSPLAMELRPTLVAEELARKYDPQRRPTSSS